MRSLSARVEQAGGRLLAVGGWVRDALLGRASEDIDLELHGIDAGRARSLFAELEGEIRRIDEVGRAFPVWLLQFSDGTCADVSLAEDPTARAGDDTALRHTRAAARRDLRINALAFDPLSAALFDPFEGCSDLEARALRCVDPRRFGDDPLRALRVARFAAQLSFAPDAELGRVCGAQSLGDVAPERMLAEWQRLLLAPDPAHGLEVLAETGVRANFPELEALDGVPQDPRWHPEGCVWTHTVMGIREATKLRTADSRAETADADRDLWLMWGALCHDFGKPGTTSVEADAIRSHAHDVVGERLVRDWLVRLRAASRTQDAVAALVRWHLAPALLVRQKSTDRGYRRLARRLGEVGVDAELLWRVARADHLGRTTAEALARDFSDGDIFLERMRSLGVERAPPRECVLGRDVLAAGIAPGPAVGRILDRCREIQDETGWTDTVRILERALANDS
ncbi:MAG: HD domain-containing protein [Myxococcota bacterium]|nr:HD domain-containing protein [Myxococcota bacterium]